MLLSRGAEKPIARVSVTQFLQSRSKMISLSTLTFLRLVMLYSGKYTMVFSTRIFFFNTVVLTVESAIVVVNCNLPF